MTTACDFALHRGSNHLRRLLSLWSDFLCSFFVQNSTFFQKISRGKPTVVCIYFCKTSSSIVDVLLLCLIIGYLSDLESQVRTTDIGFGCCWEWSMVVWTKMMMYVGRCVWCWVRCDETEEQSNHIHTIVNERMQGMSRDSLIACRSESCFNRRTDYLAMCCNNRRVGGLRRW